MQIIPKGAPDVAQTPSSHAAARERAIALVQGNAQQTPVSNPTQVSPEELSAIKTPQKDMVDTKSESKPAEAQPDAKSDPLSTQYVLLARKEKALRAKVQAQEASTQAREQALAAREEALKAKEAEYQTNYIPKSKFKADPMAVLTEEGVSYDDITAAILNPRAAQDPRITAEIEKLKAEINAQKDYQEQTRKATETQQKQAYQNAVTQIRTEAKQLVESDAEFETIKATDSVNDVVDLIEKTFQKDGVLLTVEEAAKAVEEYLVEEAMKLARITKIQSRLNPPAKKEETSAAAGQPPQMKTLTNSVNAAKKLTTRERAIAAFKNELK